MGTGFCTKLGKTWAKAEKGLNDAVSRSFVGKYFKLQARKTCFTKELRAATATFLTMAYILTVQRHHCRRLWRHLLLSDCTPPGGPDCVVKPNSGYETCLARIRNDSWCHGPKCLLHLRLSGLPWNWSMTYGTGLAVLCVEGLAFAAGIGLFIAFVGLQAHQGVGLVGPDPSTLVTAAACAHTDPVTGACVDGKMRSPTFLAGHGGALGTAVTYFPYTKVGDTKFNYFKKVVDFHRIESTAGAISFTNFNRSEVWVALMTLLYVDVLATTGILYTMAELGALWMTREALRVNTWRTWLMQGRQLWHPRSGDLRLQLYLHGHRAITGDGWGADDEGGEGHRVGWSGIYIVLSLYDYVVWVVRRAAKMRREKNQVSAAGGGGQDVEMT
ncbi:Adenine/guanine permease AZG2 [Vitis vinifera]|uniref:Adenine/guanine permease AZG2 n=1 Tax=Vitis vinifera TaxID=29760 RepID=A0A438GIJ9_VITVI|nr:Adenine/guanine permease AZG2 [Vitis vinifera]